MSKLIGKGASLLLQILFVVALVLVFSWFDPFSLLAPTKRTLKNTPIQIQSIREIGQLITSEYYGEVIASLKEVVKEQQYNELKKFNYIVNDLHENFRLIISEFIKSENELPNNKDSIYSTFIFHYPNIIDNSLYNDYLYYIFEKIKNRNYKGNEIGKKLDLNKRKKLIRKLYKNQNNWLDKFNEIETNEFKITKKEVIEKISKKEYKNSRLVLVGRGWVKAGFDFGEFTDQNFKYDKKRNRIHFIGLKPQIISATINPWFIPEEGVEGFEFLIAERGARLKPVYTKMVKQRCLDKLLNQAMDKQILARSQKNAEAHLKAFFSLLLDEEIESVHFHTNFLDYTLDVILNDSLVRNEEIFTIDSAIVYFYNTYEYNDTLKRISTFLQSLENANHEFYGKKFTLTTKSSLLFSLIQDGMIDSTEIVNLEKGLSTSVKDGIWHRSGLNIIEDSNKRETDSILNLQLQKDMEIFCTELEDFIKILSIEIDTSAVKQNYFYVRENSDSCKIAF